MNAPLHGRVPGVHASEALSAVFEHLDPAWSAVIRCIDSARDSAEVAKILSHHGVQSRQVSGNTVISVDELKTVLKRNILNGFDEIWFVSGDSPVASLANIPPATSEGADFSTGPPSEITAVMITSDCVLVLGDGCGLNYATNRIHLAEVLAAM